MMDSDDKSARVVPSADHHVSLSHPCTGATSLIYGDVAQKDHEPPKTSNMVSWLTPMWQTTQERRNSLLQLCASPSLASSSFSPSTGELSGEEVELDEIGDLLRRFDNYFREKVDHELQSVGDFLHGMLSEQQLHLQQILGRASILRSPLNSQQENASFVSGDEDAYIKHQQSQEQPEEIEMQVGVIAEYPDKVPTKTTVTAKNVHAELLMEMMALSCELSALLSQSKFL